jgi:hypothetical protein
MMIDDEGVPFSYQKLENDYAYDFKVQPNGLLSYAQFLSHHSYTGGGNCVHVVMDEDMNVVDTFQLGNGYVAEAHDFQLLPNGHVLAFGYYLTQMDLSDVVEGGYPNAMVSGGVVQELDQDKNVVWQWRSWDHYDKYDYPFGRRSNRQTVSAFHLNTINLDTDGHLFLATPSWTKKINRQTGEIMWHLGGEENEFSFIGVDSLDGVGDVTGHAFYRLENGNVLNYDNGPRTGAGTSEAHEYKLDEVNKMAEKISTFTPAEDIQAWHRGNAQRLPNGNTLVGWGGASGDPIPTCTEFDSLGNVVLEVFFDNPEIESYRAFRFPYPPAHQYEASEEEVAQGDTYDFFQGDTLDIGVRIKLTDLVSIGYSELIVTTHVYAPQFSRFEERAPVVLPQRVVLSESSLNFIGGEISFDVDLFGLGNPEQITVYFRPTVGDSIFVPLPTTYNNVTHKITAVFDDFGEFIFTYPDLAHQIIAAKPVTPGNGEWVNYKLPLQLEWSQNGFFSHFALQVATDSAFDDLLIDEQEWRQTIYDMPSVPVNEDIFWRVKTSNDAGQSDWSEAATFTTKSPYLTLKAPNGDEIWTRGLDHFIEWTGTIEEDVVLELYKENEYVSLIDTVPNTDAYRWTIPPDMDSACNYHISIRSVENAAIQDVSDVTFAINDSSCSGNTVPYVEVISPNGGEVLKKMSDVEISWKNTTGAAVKVELMKAGISAGTLFEGLSESSVTWSIADSLSNSTDYTIKVSSEVHPSVSDEGNDAFAITGATFSHDLIMDEVTGLKIYPNPVSEILHLEYSLEKAETVSVILYDLSGREMANILSGRKQSGQQKATFNMGGLPQGMYILRIQIGQRLSNRVLQYLK